MELNFTQRESSALYRLLADNTTDIILKTDCEGFITHASPAIERLGIARPDMQIGPHILDIVHPASAAAIKSEHEAAINGRQKGEWIEFPALTRDHQERWFEMQMRCLVDENDEVYGALGVMRSIEERRRIEEQLFTTAMTDPLTGLTNRRAFIAMLQHLVDERTGGCLALFGIDHFKAINMKHGQTVGDEVLVFFADFLPTLMRSNDIISRVGSESLAVLLPNAAPDETGAICQRVIDTLSESRLAAGAKGLTITASADVARIFGSLDDTMKRAEMALFFARAKGHNRLEMDEASRAVSPAPGKLQ